MRYRRSSSGIGRSRVWIPACQGEAVTEYRQPLWDGLRECGAPLAPAKFTDSGRTMLREFLLAIVDGTVRIGVWHDGSRGGRGGDVRHDGARPVAATASNDVMTVAVLTIRVTARNGRSHPY